MRTLSKKDLIEYIDQQLAKLLEQLATSGVTIEATENLRGQVLAYRAMKVAVEKTGRTDNQAAH